MFMFLFVLCSYIKVPIFIIVLSTMTVVYCRGLDGRYHCLDIINRLVKKSLVFKKNPI